MRDKAFKDMDFFVIAENKAKELEKLNNKLGEFYTPDVVLKISDNYLIIIEHSSTNDRKTHIGELLQAYEYCYANNKDILFLLILNGANDNSPKVEKETDRLSYYLQFLNDIKGSNKFKAFITDSCILDNAFPEAKKIDLDELISISSEITIRSVNMPDTIYRTIGKILSISGQELEGKNETTETKSTIEIEFDDNYRIEFKKINSVDKATKIGFGQCLNEDALLDSHKLIKNDFVISSSLQSLAMSALEKSRLVELEFKIDKSSKKEVTKIKVK